jgi:regulator of protease activity HflC (stomatin/prohibitin superfamily)
MELLSAGLVIAVMLAAFVLLVVVKTAVVVPQQSAFVVERLGRFHGVFDAGFHILVPFIDSIRYRHTLKEQAIDVPEQICITRDNVQVGVDGVLYLKVLDAQRASYGISDYHYAISQLAQTTLRSEIGKIELDRTFEERTNINAQVVSELDKATGPWGIKVLRYEIKNITPPKDVLAAMEKQMRAEREKRAVILSSEGERDAAVNTAEGKKQQVIKESEAQRQRQINEAEGQASAILAVAGATAEGIRKVAEAIAAPGGNEAVQLRVAEQYVEQFGNLARTTNTVVLPATLSDVGSMVALATNVLKAARPPDAVRATAPAPRAPQPHAGPYPPAMPTTRPPQQG